MRNEWKRLYDEVREFKEVAHGKKIKAILGVGDVSTLRNVAKASLVAMMAGADFIKTSTGKEKTNANLNNSLVMLRMIREYYDYTGIIHYKWRRSCSGKAVCWQCHDVTKSNNEGGGMKMK